MKEIWQDIKNYEGVFQISNFGKVRRLNKWDGNRYIDDVHILKHAVNRYGYCKIAIQEKGKRKMYSIHRLVAEAFVPNPENKTQVNHIDGNKQNNKVNNLEWVTPKENSLHAVATKLRTKTSNKKIYQYDLNGNFIKEWDSIRKAIMTLGITHISECGNNKRKTAGGYVWKSKR